MQNKASPDPAPLYRALLAPKSIAIVGASGDRTKVTGRPLQYLRQAGYKGKIYPINPRHETVFGERAWPSLSSLPEAPEHAFILSPTLDVISAVAECAACGVRVATILATGFSEGGPEGLRRVRQLRDVAQTSGLRILGPSSIGVVSLLDGVALTANAAFAESDLPAGGTFVASHSGSMLGALVSRGKARSIGFAGLLSVGNEIDLTLGEICAATLDNPAVTGYLLFLESLRHAEDLRSFAVEAARRKKPVVAYKLGRSEQAAELALSHTGALAGEDDIAAAFLADCGIARVENFETLIEALPLLSRVPIGAVRNRAPRVGVLTTTGGGAAMVVDGLALRGINVVKPSEETLQQLTNAGINVGHERIVDLTMAGTRPDVMKAALDTVLSGPEFDLVVAVTGSSARLQPELAVKPVIESAAAGKPLVSFLVPDAPEALAMLARAGVPSFRTPEACADAVAATFARHEPKAVLARPRVFKRAGPAQLNEWDAYKLFEKLGVPHVTSAVIPVDAATIDLPFAYPVAVKLLSDTIAHKTDVGGVVLGVQDENALRAAIASIVREVANRCQDSSVTHVLVQPMTSGLGELLLGYRKDADVGPIVLLAAGGTFTEVYRDRSIRLAPVSLEVARQMIAELAISRVLNGYRGRAAGDLGALANAIVALSRLAIEEEYSVLDAEINPLIVRRAGEGVVALDALVRLDGDS
ncbi:6-carboxyhexanoate--CoA ligase [Bradyrhizobium centrolobii]|uniref:6-carboxyhexanoate--CoA ligase n=1 Tax=Bradyrhizobium centrolobii TaxID=1505087 RepID=A0A176ZA52_9BRAD|nr:acetate--CoA ligase family protein [Bradyrhizobium centrolobii]OAF17034.1 6-carboxyhexanoate--CoA ligase [Bradyrhizobium centrolobii]